MGPIDWVPLPQNTPRHFGLLLYDQWELLDVAGPLECLNQLARGINSLSNPPPSGDDQIKLSFIWSMGSNRGAAPTMPENIPVNQFLLTDSQNQYDISNAPSDLDVLIVPGGWGPRSDEERNKVVNYIGQYWRANGAKPNKYLVTVCTGSGLAAESGALNGLPATTNKMAYKNITSESWANKTYWIAEARFVDAGQVWTTSGVSAGTDGFLAWMNTAYGSVLTNGVINMMEYEVHSVWNEDPFGQNLVAKGLIEDVPDSGNEKKVDWPNGFPQPHPIERTWVDKLR